VGKRTDSPIEGRVMRIARVRLSVRELLAVVAIVSLALGWVAYRERLRRQLSRVLNQDITVSSAEVNYRNAGLAREAAEAAVARRESEHGGEGENPGLSALRGAAKTARRKELDLEAVWKTETNTLWRLIIDLYDSWP
jgi:hypothetical protein